MKASLDTNVIIHFYRAGLQDILFDFFDEGVEIYEQIRYVELEHHGKDVLVQVDADIASGRMRLYTEQKLRDLAVYRIFDNHVRENRNLFGTGDLGEVYAISLAQTLGTYSLVTDDTKQGGPYMSLLQFADEVMPFSFADVLILRYITGQADGRQTVVDFERINHASQMNWSFQSHLSRFIRRFFRNPYRQEDKKWLMKLAAEHGIRIKSKLEDLHKLLNTHTSSAN